MTPRVSEETNKEILEGIKLMLATSPDKNGVSAVELHRTLFPEMHYSTVSSAAKLLKEQGYLTSEKGKNDNNKSVVLYTPTKKGFVPTFQPGDEAIAPKAKPQFAGFVTTSSNLSPADPAYWKEKLEQTISGLELLQSVVPGLLAGLLDLTKNLERLDNVKKILGDLEKVARRNV